VNLDVAVEERPAVVGNDGGADGLRKRSRAADRLGDVGRRLSRGGHQDVYLVGVIHAGFTVVGRLEAERHGSSSLLAVPGVRAEVCDPGDTDVIRRRPRWRRARAERADAAAETAAHQAVEDARVQAAAVFLSLVLPLALHGGALRVEVVEAAEAAAGRAHLPCEFDVIGVAAGDGTAAGDAAARLNRYLADAAPAPGGRGTDLVRVGTGAVARRSAAVLARSLTDAAPAPRGRCADLVGIRAEAVAGGCGGVLARGLADAAPAPGSRRTDLVGVGAEAVAGGCGGVLARGLADAAPASGGRRTDLVRVGTGAVAGGCGGVLARGLTDAAPASGGRRTDLVRVGTGAVAGGRRGVLARGLTDAAAAGRGRRTDLVGIRARAVAGGRRCGFAWRHADARLADHDAALSRRTRTVAGRGRVGALLDRRNADVGREGERHRLQRALVDAARARQVGQGIGVGGEHEEVRADARLGRAAGGAHRRPALRVGHAEDARRRTAVWMERYVGRIARLPEDDDARPARGVGAVVLRHAELARGQLAVRAYLTDAAAQAVEAAARGAITASGARKARLDAAETGRAGRAGAAGAVVVHDAHAAGDAGRRAEAAEPEARQQVCRRDDGRATADLVGDDIEADAVHRVDAGHGDRAGHRLARVGDRNGYAGRAQAAGALIRRRAAQPRVRPAHADGRGADAVRNGDRVVAIAVARACDAGLRSAEADGLQPAA